MRTLAISTTLALALSLTACGSDDEDTADGGSDSSGGVPACDEVWVVGETLDLDTYEGCQDGDTIVASVTRGCYDADSKYVGQIATLNDELWVVQEGTSQQDGTGGTPGEVTDENPNC